MKVLFYDLTLDFEDFCYALERYQGFLLIVLAIVLGLLIRIVSLKAK